MLLSCFTEQDSSCFGCAVTRSLKIFSGLSKSRSVMQRVPLRDSFCLWFCTSYVIVSAYLPGFKSAFAAAATPPHRTATTITQALLTPQFRFIICAARRCSFALSLRPHLLSLLRVVGDPERPQRVEHESGTLPARHVSSGKLLVLRNWPQHNGIFAGQKRRLRRHLVFARIRFLQDHGDALLHK